MISSRSFPALQSALAGVWLALAVLSCGGAASPSTTPETLSGAGRAPSTHAKARVELSADEIVRSLRGSETDLRRCFLANPSVRGAVRFSWRLDVDGKVQHVQRQRSTLGDARVEACLGQRLSEIDFGDFAEPMAAHWTFVFRLVDPSAPAGRAQRHGKRPRSGDERGLSIDPASPGTLPSDAIDNVVEAGYPLFARCYRDGVNRNDALAGTLRLRFAIGAQGQVSEVSDAGSDLSDSQVVDCVAEGFYALRFPEPAHGQVNVLYRILFEPG